MAFFIPKNSLELQLIIPLLFLIGSAHSIGHHENGCIQVPILSKNHTDIQGFCEFLETNKSTGSKVLFISNNSGIIHQTETVLRIVNEHCLLEVYNFNVQNLSRVETAWTKSIEILIFDEIPFDLSGSIRAFGRCHDNVLIYVLKAAGDSTERSNRDKRWDVEISNDLWLCDATSNNEFSGSPNPTESPLTISARRLEPFAIADNGSIFNRGIEIMLIEAIAQKLNIQLNYDSEHSSHQG